MQSDAAKPQTGCAASSKCARKNPWHGKIKVREELKWLEKWDRGN